MTLSVSLPSPPPPSSDLSSVPLCVFLYVPQPRPYLLLNMTHTFYFFNCDVFPIRFRILNCVACVSVPISNESGVSEIILLYTALENIFCCFCFCRSRWPVMGFCAHVLHSILRISLWFCLVFANTGKICTLWSWLLCPVLCLSLSLLSCTDPRLMCDLLSSMSRR